jgi:hypothetical protein
MARRRGRDVDFAPAAARRQKLYENATSPRSNAGRRASGVERRDVFVYFDNGQGEGARDACAFADMLGVPWQPSDDRLPPSLAAQDGPAPRAPQESLARLVVKKCASVRAMASVLLRATVRNARRWVVDHDALPEVDAPAAGGPPDDLAARPGGAARTRRNVAADRGAHRKHSVDGTHPGVASRRCRR